MVFILSERFGISEMNKFACNYQTDGCFVVVIDYCALIELLSCLTYSTHPGSVGSAQLPQASQRSAK